MRAAGLLGVIAVITLVAAVPAAAAAKKPGKKSAPPPVAAPLSPQVERSLKLLDDGDYTGALANLTEAQKTDAAPDELTFHIGRAQKGLLQYSDAVKSFETYLQKGKAADKKAAAKQFIAEIKDVAAVVTVTIPGDPAELFVDGERMGKSPFKAPLLFAPGKHTFSARREGQPPLEKTEDLLGGAAVSLVLQAPVVSTAPEPLKPQVFVEGDPPPPEEERPKRKFPLLGIAVAAGGLAFIGGSVALSVFAGSRSNEVSRLVAEGGTWDSYYDRRQAEGERFEAWSAVAAVIGAAALTTGAIMTLVSLLSSDTPSGGQTIDDIAPLPEQTRLFISPTKDGAVAGLVRRW